MVVSKQSSGAVCESRGGRPGLPSLINLRFLWSCVKVEVDVLGSRPNKPMVSVELWESLGGRPELPSLINLWFVLM